MAIKLGLWTLTLLPGDTYPISVQKDFQLTNAALGEELKDSNGRSVIKVTHQPLPAAYFEASDSEDDDSDVEGDLPSDEFELDSEEGFRKIVKEAREAQKNGDIPAGSDDDEEEDEDFEGDEDDSEDDDEDMSDEDDDELLETTVLCALTAGKIEQATLNVTFTEGDVVMFEVTGDNAVHLIGNYIEQFPDQYNSDSDSEFDSDEQDDYSDLELEDLTDDEDVPAKSRITEINEVSEPKKAIKAKATKSEEKAAPVSEKKRKAEEAGDVSMTSTDGLSKNQKKKLAKKAKTEDTPAPAAAAPAPKEKKDIKAGKRTLASGLEYEDIKTGTGPVAKPGKRLSMRYIGKLTNGKQFDANTAGAPFSFVLGRGEVIKGWDQGLNGMAVGGERKLSIPANLAYGKQKIPGIPANSTLNFEVKLLAVK